MRILFACLAVLAVIVPARSTAQTDGGDRAAIVAVIAGQMAAFRDDRSDDAFSYASPAIRRLFGTPQSFMEMVRRGYAPVYRPRSVAFLDLVSTPRGPVQRVLVVGPDGVAVIADYLMQRQADGSWRIDGCTLRRPAGGSA